MGITDLFWCILSLESKKYWKFVLIICCSNEKGHLIRVFVSCEQGSIRSGPLGPTVAGTFQNGQLSCRHILPNF